MNAKLTTTLLVTGILLGGSQVINLTNQGTSQATTIVAHAATTTDGTSGTVGTATWQVSADGELTLADGTLPVATSSASPLKAIINQIATDTGITVTQVTIGDQVKAPANSSYLFAAMPGITQINQLRDLDVSDVTDMTSMFSSNSALTSADITGWDTRNVTTMQAMFNSNSALTTVKIGQLDTPKLTNMQVMFALDSRLTDLDLSGIDNTLVTNNYMMLSNDYNLVNLNLGNWSAPVGSSAAMLGYNLGTLKKISNLHQITLSSQMKMGTGTFLELNDTQYPLFDGTVYTGKWENIKDQYQPVGTAGKRVYTMSELESLYDGTHTDELAANETYVWEPLLTPEKAAGEPVTIHYVDQNGRTIKDDDQKTGKVDETYTIEPATIAGYTLKETQGSVTGTFTNQAQSVTFIYQSTDQSSSSSTTTSNNSSSNATSNDSSTGSSSNSNGTPSADSSNQVSSGAADAIQPKMSVTAVKKIGFYRTATFSAKNRMKWFAKQPQAKRPQFVVVKTAYSKKGLLRYYVKDVNRHSKTYGKRGYITTRAAYVRGTYATKKPKAIRVVNPKGINGYKTAKLTGKTTHYRRGQRLVVKKLVRHNLTIRYQLTNGRYVSANLNFSKSVK